MRRVLLLALLVALIVLASIGWRERSPDGHRRALAQPTIVKQPARIVTRTFDPAGPPSDMPPLPSGGEVAECDSNFTSNANVGGQAQRTDSTHAVMTVTQISVTLQLEITIWVPADVSQHVMEHEQGHRQISERYYETADKLAAQIASRHMGKEVAISGSDLDTEFHKTLRDVGAEITEEYEKELNPNPTQLLYDSITDHSRNDVAVQDAVEHALKNVVVESEQPAGAESADQPH